MSATGPQGPPRKAWGVRTNRASLLGDALSARVEAQRLTKRVHVEVVGIVALSLPANGAAVGQLHIEIGIVHSSSIRRLGARRKPSRRMCNPIRAAFFGWKSTLRPSIAPSNAPKPASFDAPGGLPTSHRMSAGACRGQHRRPPSTCLALEHGTPRGAVRARLLDVLGHLPMALRTGHGTGAGQQRIEVLPADELPPGVRGEPAPAELASDRDERGTFSPGNSLAKLGGKASWGKSRLSHRLALGEQFADPRFEPYARAARAFRRQQLAELARSVGGGYVGPGAASVVASSALQLAGSRFAFEVLGDMQLGSRLANDSRQNLLAAFELTAKEAQARPKRSPLAALLSEGEEAGR